MERDGVRGSLGESWDPRDNGITALRLGLAAFVAFSHAFPLGGFGRDPVFVLTSGQAQGGTVAVSAFFALSGFLLVQSRSASPLGPFVWHRALRIFPAYWICLAVVALALAPSEMWSYVRANAFLIINQHTLGDVFASNPLPYEVNGSLWTLAPEFGCYLALAIMPRRWLTVLVPAVLVFITVLHLSTDARTLLHDLILSFAVGATLGIARDWVPLRGVVALAGAAILAIATAVGQYTAVAPFVIAYLTLAVAVRLPLRWRRDYSYGAYVYAFPVEQSLTTLGLPALGLVAYLAGTTVISGALAAASWHLVEHPVLRRGRRRRPTRAVAPDDATQAISPVPAPGTG